MFADGITSANVVGYQTSALLPNDYTMFGIQFQGVDGNGVKFKDLSGNFLGGDGMASADNILVWLPEDGYHTYYYGDWGEAGEAEGWNNKWWTYDSTIREDVDASDMTIEAGTACWYLRVSDAVANLTISGQVKVTPTTTTILANDYTMFCNPYPTAITFANLKVSNPTGGDGMASADNILVWVPEDGYHYYYYGDWGEAGEAEGWNNKWWTYDGTVRDDVDASDMEIPVGRACWYLRYADTATTISFTSPLAE